jgi:hypothetical protein
MFTEQRKDERIIDVGRVEAPELCVFPGILEDISMFGSKIRFPAPVDVELNMDVDLTISPSGNTSQPLKIIAQPKWVKKEGNSTEIGFKFLRSPGTRLLNAYIEKLALANAEFEEEEELLCSGM